MHPADASTIQSSDIPKLGTRAWVRTAKSVLCLETVFVFEERQQLGGRRQGRCTSTQYISDGPGLDALLHVCCQGPIYMQQGVDIAAVVRFQIHSRSYS